MMLILEMRDKIKEERVSSQNSVLSSNFRIFNIN